MDEGLSYGEAGAALAMTAEEAYQRCLTPGSRKGDPLTLEERAEIVRRALLGERNRDLAEDFRCGPKTIHRILREQGVPLHRGRNTRRITLENELRALAMRDQGFTTAQIARELRTSVRVITAVYDTHDPNFRSETWISDPPGYEYICVSQASPYFSMGRKLRSGNRSVVPVHRLVMAESLGRVLLSSETVHHKNANRADNRLENLQLRRGKHGAGAAFTCRSCGSHDVEAVPIVTSEDLGAS